MSVPCIMALGWCTNFPKFNVVDVVMLLKEEWDEDYGVRVQQVTTAE